ncbi:hypothetical protein R3I93_019360 [Phoxinus phoxinus]|uniref:Uncharacterized protein n=1 Tax=Phoxinus phoxinus TaxID=58324 RepID=A0AAN9CCP9_9TELE
MSVHTTLISASDDGFTLHNTSLIL